MTDTELLAVIESALAELPFTSRKMFGGIGLYLAGSFFGIISDGTLYLRTDDASRPDYVVLGMRALQPKHRPRGPRTVDRNFEVPAAVIAAPDVLREWALRAAQCTR
jgi:DNA transformation protein